MFLRTVMIWLVQAITFTRLVAGLLFVALALRKIPSTIPVILYGVAMCSDLVDGYLARRLGAGTYLGKIFDLVSDRSLTTISLLYAAARGIDLFPIALIAVRDVITLGARLVLVDGAQLFPSNKRFGVAIQVVLWTNTLFLALAGKEKSLIGIANEIYWMCAIILIVNFIRRVYCSMDRVRTALTVR